MKLKKPLRIDVRDIRIPGGRFTCSARTTSAPEFRKREAAVRAIIDAGAYDVLKRLTATGADRLHISEATAAVQRGDIEGLRMASGGPLMLGATIDRLKQRKKATRSKGTQEQVDVACGQLEAHFGVLRNAKGVVSRDVEMMTIDSKACEDFIHGKRPNGAVWAPNTQGVRHSYAKEIWELAITEEAEAAERENRKPRLRRNPWKSIEPAPVHRTRMIYLTADERDAMLRKLEGTPLCAFMAIAYHAGLRLIESTMLRTDVDVDLSAGVLHIQARPGEWAWRTKNKRDRDVPINRTLRGILERHIEKGFAGQRFLFRTPRHDRPLSRATARDWWIDAYEVAGIKWGRSDADAVVHHTGRHTFASLMVQQGVSPLIVAELLGDHLNQVVEVYGHLAPHNLADAVKLLEAK